MKRFFENLSIKSKLGAGFYSILFLFVIFALFQYLTLQKLANEQNKGFRKSSDAALVNQISSMGYKLYMGAATYKINNGKDGSDADWIKYKKESESMINELDSIADTGEEKEEVKNIKIIFSEFAQIVEEQIMTSSDLPSNASINSDTTKSDSIANIPQAESNTAMTLLEEKSNLLNEHIENVAKSIEKEMIENDDQFDRNAKSDMLIMLIFVVLAIGFVLIVIYFFTNIIVPPVKNMTNVLNTLATGELERKDIDFDRKDEIGEMGLATNKLITGLFSTANFAGEIGKGNLTAEFKPLSEKDTLGNALLEMQSSLIKAEEEEQVRKEEDDRRNWATAGYAKFGEILRQNNDDMEALSFDVIKNLVNYTEMNQGGIFIINENNSEHHFLEMTACFAYDRQKFIQKNIEIGEGLIGACYQEGKTIYITQIPNNYIEITSGLGEANPSCILVVPLKLNDQIYGIIEMASFKPLGQHTIEFVEKIGESIASTISSVKVNVRTAQLLETSQQQAEEMRAQEEEMRQNMEEMHATQEETARRELLIRNEYQAQEEKLHKQIQELKEKEDQVAQNAEEMQAIYDSNSLKLRRLEEENVKLKEEIDELKK